MRRSERLKGLPPYTFIAKDNKSKFYSPNIASESQPDMPDQPEDFNLTIVEDYEAGSEPQGTLAELKRQLECAKQDAEIERSARQVLERELLLLQRTATQPSAIEPIVQQRSANGMEIAVSRPSSNYSASGSSATTTTTTTTASSSSAVSSLQGDIHMQNERQYDPSVPFIRKTHDLPVFSGVPEQWPVFIAAFRQSTEALRYTPLENIFRLQKCLIGEARESVDMLLVHPDTIEEAIETLQFQFGRPELLAASQVAKARSIMPFSERQIDQLVPFSRKVRNLVAYLQHADCEYELLSPTLLNELLGKMPMSKRLEWAQHSVELRPRATVVQFSQWLANVARYVSLTTMNETIQHQQPSSSNGHQSRSHPPARQRRETQARNTMMHINLPNTTNAFVAPLCSLCSRPHAIAECFTFLNWNIAERWDKVKRMRWCFTCLHNGHDTAACPNKQRCVIANCRRYHHPLLHELENQPPPQQYEHRQGNPFSRRPANSAPPPPVVATHFGSETRQNSGSSLSNPPTNQSTISHPSSSGNQSNNSQLPAIPSTSAFHHVRNENSPQSLLFRIIPVKLFSATNVINTYAMIDEGSELTIMDDDIANQLQLHGPASELNLQWFGNNTKTVPSRQVSLEISGVNASHKRFPMPNVKTVPNINLPIQSLNIDNLHSSCRHLKRLPIIEYANAEAKILIGLDFCHLAAPNRMVHGGQHGPIVVNTDLGWIVYGRQTSDPTTSCKRIYHTRSTLEDINAIVRDYFTTENFGVKPPSADLESIEDARARTILETTTTRLGNRYQVGLLWRSDDIRLPNNYSMALRRLITIENKMSRDPQYAVIYNNNILDYIKKGYAKKLSIQEAKINNQRTWYLPHFGVVNPHKPLKMRMVFDAAANMDGSSLNSMLLSGPDWNPPLTGILFKFRIGLVGICGDIKEMFNQVIIQPSDRSAQRFLWRQGDTSRPPDIYEMTTMTFGATCSPATAQFVKNKNADHHANEFPSAVYPIKNLHYVDDYVASFSSPSEAAAVTQAVIEVHRRGGFELRNFVSSCPDVLQQIGASPNIKQSPVSMQPKNEISADRILGMCWDTQSDEFFFNPNLHKIDPSLLRNLPPTKRKVLSIAMSIFDPFGILADFMLHAKLLIQDLWRAGTGWDEPIPIHLQQRWLQWTSGLEAINTCRISRCYSPHILLSTNVQLHILADASESAFAAVAYFRIEYAGAFETSFIAGKTKCAPLKLLSVPRLELQAAILATRLLHTIRENHQTIAIAKTILWTDSKCVVQWIRSDHRRFKPFVAHRVAEILDETTAANWRWLPTSANVADDATRAKGVPKFFNDSRWIRGAEFLRSAEDQWPLDATINQEAEEASTEEIRPSYVALTTFTKPIIDVNNFSNYGRLRRTFAWVQRFAFNALSKHRNQLKRCGELTSIEIDDAELSLCRIIQRDAFKSEYAALSRGHVLEPDSSIRKLMPYLDEDKRVLRIFGRTDAADDDHLSLAAKRPILLPPKHAFTNLVVNFYHRRMQHQNDSAVICAIRNRFWVPHLRSAVRRSRSDCMMCRLREAKPKPPVMGQLPSDRLTPYVRPFSFTGLDYFGPILVTIGRRTEKRWVALFTCLTIRAVHLEIAENLSSDACLVSLNNFGNLRGFPIRIRSDNGTNFVGASKIIRDATSSLNQNHMRSALAERGIEWVFNSPGHPEAGGCWERLVQSVKRVLASMLHETAPRVETLRCFLLEAANIINSRPLTHVPVSPNDEDPITPNHFLIGGPSASSLPNTFDFDLVDTRKQWRIAQHLANCFWKQWIRSYLPELTRRSKWFVEQPALKLNDLVLICDSNQTRNQWRRGRVVSIFPGRDGRIRNAEVKTSDGIVKRPTSKLAVLDISCESRITSIHGGRDVVDGI